MDQTHRACTLARAYKFIRLIIFSWSSFIFSSKAYSANVLVTLFTSCIFLAVTHTFRAVVVKHVYHAFLDCVIALHVVSNLKIIG